MGLRAITLVFTTLSGCAAAGPVSSAAGGGDGAPCPERSGGEALGFQTSPGGVPEIGIDGVRPSDCRGQVRIIDVREREELETEGHIEGAEHVPLSRLGEAAAAWNPRDPVVLVCRSGRRSTRGVRLLESMGFDRVASMTGGMLAWTLAGYPVTRPDVPTTHRRRRETKAAVSADSLEGALRSTPPRRVRAASLLLSGTEACVDGREPHAVLGTPGGDAGELLLALSTVEALIERSLSDLEVRSLFDAYLQSFGRFYIHTDDHALDHLRRDLEADPRFDRRHLGAGAAGLADYLRHPALQERAPLLEHLLHPENVGCGHLRLVLTHPAEYGVRPGLTLALGRVVHERLWEEPEVIDFVVLHGEHHEEAVVNVSIAEEVHAFTNVPAIPPTLGGHSVFVNHPEVAAFVRREHAKFLWGEIPALAEAGIDLPRFVQALETRAAAQLEETLGHLAARLPVFDLRLERDATRVVLSQRAADLDCLPPAGCAQCEGCQRGSPRGRKAWPRPRSASERARP